MSETPVDYSAQEREMLAAWDLRTCQDCDARVCYAFTKRKWPGFAAKCGAWTVRPRQCPDGYYGDRGPYPAGELEAMPQDHLFREMTRAFNAQADAVDYGGSDDASYKAERRCEVVMEEIKSRGLEDAYWVVAEDRPTSPDAQTEFGGSP